MIIENLNFPEKTYIGKTISKTLFYNNCSLSKNQRDIFQNVIDKITLTNSLKKSTINMQPYEDEENYYEEIIVLKVSLKEKGNIGGIGEMLNHAIPYPLIIEFNYDDMSWLYLCKKRKSRSVKNEFVVEEPIEKDFSKNEIESLKNEILSYNSFLTYYISLHNFIVKLRYVEQANGMVIKGDEFQISHEKLKELEELKAEISQLKNKLNKEKQLNKKADIMKILKEKIAKLEKLN